jgi:hypothetical protein
VDEMGPVTAKTYFTARWLLCTSVRNGRAGLTRLPDFDGNSTISNR